MSKIEKTVKQMTLAPQNVRFSDLVAVCAHYFGEPRQDGTSHKVYKTPWRGDPRVNIQDKKGMAKPYQVRQVLEAIARMDKQEGGTR
ncbi:MAG: toxin HicA [Pseudomonadota bacterium]